MIVNQNGGFHANNMENKIVLVLNCGFSLHMSFNSLPSRCN